MPGFHKIIPCAAIAALVFAGGSRITGQAPVENGRPIALAAAEDTLPAALERVDAMLTSGELNISQLKDDTLIPGRAIERLGQYYEGLPVFGGHVVRQMDGRAVISVTGRLYESLTLDVNPVDLARARQRGCCGRWWSRRQRTRRCHARHPARRKWIPPRLSHEGLERLGDP